ncbi:hypothetical protein LHP98_03025 [Rhodobacter sp. Har01]|uniref:hypothetical protein n=1 Tax=Rhodobacter sp. Har01 TaxID=2883999 RepID=UPI001D094D2A|nr:hypothetical protein [Rhodobacter sp. Har01]MCB6177101.1 hypothetical protein [Rhodobacter sp. Har01]
MPDPVGVRPAGRAERTCAIVKFLQVFYVLDRTHRLLWVGGDWDDFAAQNEGDLARASRVLSSHLEDHLVGTETQDVMRGVLDDVLALKRSFRIEYRCDSPTLRRDMRMTITAMRADRLLVTHDLLDARSFPPIGPGWTWLPGAFDCKCSFCCGLRRADGWVDPFTTGKRHPELVDYGVCPACRAMIDRERTRIRKAGRVN